jgi:hypothetical protein
MVDESPVLVEMQQQLVSISNTVGQIQATLTENAKRDEQTRRDFQRDLTELWGAVRVMKEETASKKEIGDAFNKIRALEDMPRNAALARQQTFLRWVLAPLGIVVGGWVLFMLTKIGLTPPK